MIHLMKEPDWLSSAVNAGTAYVNGALVKDAATHQILAHLQPTKMLSNSLSLVGDGVLAPLELASSLGQNWQLLQVQKMLDTLQIVAGIGSAASVLNLGVSVGGFALVLSAINKLDGKVGKLHHTMRSVEHKVDTPYFSELSVVLRRAEDGFQLTGTDQRERWQDIENRADSMIEQTLHRLAGHGLNIEPRGAVKPSATSTAQLARPLVQAGTEPSQLLTVLMHLVSTRSEALLCLQRPLEAAKLAQRQVDWLSLLPSDLTATAFSLTEDRTLPSRQLQRVVGQAKALTTWVNCSQEAARQRTQLCQTLHDRGVDTLTYVNTVRNHPEPTLLVLPHCA